MGNPSYGYTTILEVGAFSDITYAVHAISHKPCDASRASRKYLYEVATMPSLNS